MRIKYKYGVGTMSGKVGNIVHIPRQRRRIGIGRDYVKPKMTAQNYLFGEIRANIANIWKECSEAYKSDLKEYAVRRIPFYSGEELPAYSNYAHFTKFLYSYCEKHPAIDPASVTKDDLAAGGCPANVAEIIVEGYLPSIPETSALTNEW